jgi:hypothetical protein
LKHIEGCFKKQWTKYGLKSGGLKSMVRGEEAYSNNSKGQQLQKPLSEKFVDGRLELLEALR